MTTVADRCGPAHVDEELNHWRTVLRTAGTDDVEVAAAPPRGYPAGTCHNPLDESPRSATPAPAKSLLTSVAADNR